MVPAMRVVCLQSGSNGNCTYVETPDVRLLIDAGISAARALQRLADVGLEATGLHAVLLTHDHGDHARHLGVYQRKLGLPVYATEGTMAAALARLPLGNMTDVRTFRAGAALAFGDTRVRSIPTPHDSTDGVAFVVSAGSKRLGVLTDLGHPFDDLRSVVGSLDGVVIEANYAPDMLSRGPYPSFLKQRIRGPGGHLSNDEAGQLLRDHASPRLRWACLTHLSEQNNDPELALQTVRRYVGRRLRLNLAGRHAATEIMSV